MNPSTNNNSNVKLALQFPSPPVLLSNNPAHVKKYTEDVSVHLNDLNKVLQRTFQQMATLIDGKQNKA